MSVLSVARKRYRKMFPFQLDLNKPEEYEIAQQIKELKRKRSFSKTVRDGIRLICDLRKGRLDVLHELFPWVWEQVALEIETEAQEAPLPETLTAKLARMEQQLLQLGAVPVEAGTPPSQVPIPIALEDTHDDFELEVQQATHDENNRSDWNFMIASALQVHGDCDGLPPDIVDYGLRTGRLQPHQVNRPPPPAVPEQIKSIAGADAAFVPPDDELDGLLDEFT